MFCLKIKYVFHDSFFHVAPSRAYDSRFGTGLGNPGKSWNLKRKKVLESPRILHSEKRDVLLESNT